MINLRLSPFSSFYDEFFSNECSHSDMRTLKQFEQLHFIPLVDFSLLERIQSSFIYANIPMSVDTGEITIVKYKTVNIKKYILNREKQRT